MKRREGEEKRCREEKVTTGIKMQEFIQSWSGSKARSLDRREIARYPCNAPVCICPPKTPYTLLLAMQRPSATRN